jgi:hypothetical protein
LEGHKKKKMTKKKLRRGIPLSVCFFCSLWRMHILEPPLTPIGNRMGEEIEKRNIVKRKESSE